MRGKREMPAELRKRFGVAAAPSSSSSSSKAARKGALAQWGGWRAAVLVPLALAVLVLVVRGDLVRAPAAAQHHAGGNVHGQAAAANRNGAAAAPAPARANPDGPSIDTAALTTTDEMRARVKLGDADKHTPSGRFSYNMRAPFYSVEQFPAFKLLQDHWEEIRDEANSIKAVLEMRRRQDEWGEGAVRFAQRLIAAENRGWVISWDGGGGWLNYALAYFGSIVPGVTEEWAPKTVALLRNIPGIRIGGFSRLLPNAYIAPHTDTTGLAYHSLAFHLCLSGRASLRLGDDWVEQVPGKILIFDTTLEHEVLNGPDDRIVLYMDFDIDLFLRGTEGFDPAAELENELA